MKKTLNEFIFMLRDLLKILGWKETWIVPAAAMGIVGFWCIFAWSMTLPSPIRAIIMWGIIIGLSILAPKQ